MNLYKAGKGFLLGLLNEQTELNSIKVGTVDASLEKHVPVVEFEGNKVKVSVRFRGRELAHPELGKVVLEKILEALTNLGVAYNLDKGAFMEGKMMSMTVSPAKNK